MNTNFAHLCAENKTLDTNKIANIQQFFKHTIIHFGLRLGANIVATNINLYAAFGVLKLHKRSFPHYPTAHYTSSYTNLHSSFIVGKSIFYIGRKCVGWIQCGRIRIDAEIT